MSDKAVYVPKSPPPWPPDLDTKPHIPIGCLTRVGIAVAGNDPIGQFHDFFPDFRDWCQSKGVSVGLREDRRYHSQMWLVVYGEEAGLRDYLVYWKGFFTRFLWLFATRPDLSLPKLVSIQPMAADMDDVQAFFPHAFTLNEASPRDWTPFDTFFAISHHPAALVSEPHTEGFGRYFTMRCRTAQDAVLARLSGLV